VDSQHGGATGLANDIDAACQASGLWPDAVLSGHAHLYQRFSRKVDGLARTIPYVVSGSGGFAATPPQGSSPAAGTTIGNYTLVTPPVIDFGYLTLTVDLKNSAAGALTISYRSPGQPKEHDSVTVPLAAVGMSSVPSRWAASCRIASRSRKCLAADIQVKSRGKPSRRPRGKPARSRH